MSYKSIKVLAEAVEKLEDFKNRHGYPSYSQAIVALTERAEKQDKIIEEIENKIISSVREMIKEELRKKVIVT